MSNTQYPVRVRNGDAATVQEDAAGHDASSSDCADVLEADSRDNQDRLPDVA